MISQLNRRTIFLYADVIHSIDPLGPLRVSQLTSHIRFDVIISPISTMLQYDKVIRMVVPNFSTITTCPQIIKGALYQTLGYFHFLGHDLIRNRFWPKSIITPKRA